MDGLKRCLRCSRLPEVKIEDLGTGCNVVLSCEEHGFEAQGNSLEQAKEHWNRFVTFMAAA